MSELENVKRNFINFGGIAGLNSCYLLPREREHIENGIFF